MLETDSGDYLDRFDKIIARLESLKGKLPEAARARKKRNRRIFWFLLGGLLLAGSIGIAVTLYPQFWQLR